MLGKDYNRILAKYPRQVKAVETYIEELGKAEDAQESNIDKISGLTGTMLGEIFAWREDIWAEELRYFGFYLGKFVYLMDAYEDIEEDLKQGRYNPFTELYKKETFEQDCQQILKMMMAETSKVFEQLPILEDAEILRNILYAGVWTRYGQIRCRRKETKKEA